MSHTVIESFYVGIVGSDGRKFDKLSEKKARDRISQIIAYEIISHPHMNIVIVSGHCHLGGIDIFAEEIANKFEISMIPYPPNNLRWEPDGFKARNMRIAQKSDILYVLSNDDWNGGMWTGNYAKKLGKTVKFMDLR